MGEQEPFFLDIIQGEQGCPLWRPGDPSTLSNWIQSTNTYFNHGKICICCQDITIKYLNVSSLWVFESPRPKPTPPLAIIPRFIRPKIVINILISVKWSQQQNFLFHLFLSATVSLIPPSLIPWSSGVTVNSTPQIFPSWSFHSPHSVTCFLLSSSPHSLMANSLVPLTSSLWSFHSPSIPLLRLSSLLLLPPSNSQVLRIIWELRRTFYFQYEI